VSSEKSPHHKSVHGGEFSQIRLRPTLLQLGWYFFLIALTTVQGAAGHMRRQIVQHRKLIT
jgi:hypothetical protein